MGKEGKLTKIMNLLKLVCLSQVFQITIKVLRINLKFQNICKLSEK